MKRTMICVAALSVVLSAACSRSAPGPGEEAVLIEKPLFFGHGGVDSAPVRTGAEFVALTTDSVVVNMQPRRFDEAFEDLMSSDNVPMSFHAMPRLQVIDSVALITKFGDKWYENNVQRQFQNFVRNWAKQYSMTDLAINQNAVFEMEQRVKKELDGYLVAQQIPARCLEVTIGRIAPPENVIEQQKQTAEQQQRIKTEANKKLAEDARKAAEVSRALADQAYQQTMGLTSSQFVQLETMKMCVQKQQCSVFMGASPIPVVTGK